MAVYCPIGYVTLPFVSFPLFHDKRNLTQSTNFGSDQYTPPTSFVRRLKTARIILFDTIDWATNFVLIFQKRQGYLALGGGMSAATAMIAFMANSLPAHQLIPLIPAGGLTCTHNLDCRVSHWARKNRWDELFYVPLILKTRVPS